MTDDLEIGAVLVRRYLRGRHVSWVQTARVVAQDDRGLFAWVAEGSGFATRIKSDGAAARAEAIDVFADATLRPGRWSGCDVLILMPAQADYSVWWFFVAGSFTGWYVNLEARGPLWTEGGVRGVDVVDHELDIVVDPQRAWAWKDEDDLRAVTGLPGYWDDAAASRIRATGLGVIAAIDNAAFPFDRTYTTFRPPADWVVARMPVFPGSDGEPIEPRRS
jgi:hypothetical protein